MESYYHRFNEVLKHIHFNLDEKLDLDELAKIASVSKYHFHRMIKSYLGESLGTYVNRIKIETGAKLLKYSDSSISEIAYKIGYETPTSFNKGFKKQFGVSPSNFRKNPNHSFEIGEKPVKKKKFELKVEEENVPQIMILTNQSKGAIGTDDMEVVWETLMSFAGQNGLLTENTKLFGVHWDDPSITLSHNLRYDACISTDKEVKHPRFVIKGIGGGKYLCFTYKGDYQNLKDVYDQIFREYILTKNILLREEPLFDHFLNDKNKTATEDLLTKIFVPIQ